jgi:IQ domain-containing protein H
MNMMTISKSLGEVLYSKGIFGHITVDLVSFPDPTSPQSHPLFWAVDLNCGLTDYATACFFFDFLMVTINLLTFYRRENLISSLENTL